MGQGLEPFILKRNRVNLCFCTPDFDAHGLMCLHRVAVRFSPDHEIPALRRVRFEMNDSTVAEGTDPTGHG